MQSTIEVDKIDFVGRRFSDALFETRIEIVFGKIVQLRRDEGQCQKKRKVDLPQRSVVENYYTCG